LILIQKYSYFLEKINGWRFFENFDGDQKLRWHRVDLNRNSIETPSSGFVRNIFLLIFSVAFKKSLACAFFLNENMSCDRYFSSIELIFGLSHCCFLEAFLCL
jgi:hypothetical protein